MSNNDLIDAMYGDTPNDEDPAGAPEMGGVVTLPTGLKSQRITVDERTYHVPTLAYAGALEGLVTELGQQLAQARTQIAQLQRTQAQQQRLLHRAEQMLHATRSGVRRQAKQVQSGLNDIRHEVNTSAAPFPTRTRP